jgi:hypothetical protein
LDRLEVEAGARAGARARTRASRGTLNMKPNIDINGAEYPEYEFVNWKEIKQEMGEQDDNPQQSRKSTKHRKDRGEEQDRIE